MNIHKHMEAIFVVAFAAAVLGSSAFDSMTETGAGPATPVMRDVAAAPAANTAAVMCAVRAPRRA